MQITYQLTPQQLPSLGGEHVLLLPLQRSSQRKARGQHPSPLPRRSSSSAWQ